MISIFKKKTETSQYSKEIVFQLYTFNSNLLIDYYNTFVKMGAVIENISGKIDYYSGYDEVVNDIDEIKKGLVISVKDGYAMYMGCNKHKESELFYFSYHFNFDEDIIEKINTILLTQENVYYAYLNNYYDVKWQNQDSIEVYNVNKKSLKGLSFGLDLWDNKCIDTSKNYGRSIFKEGVLYMAAYCTWFGEIINSEELKEKLDFVFLAGFSDNKLLRVQLFKDINEDYSKYRDKQKKLLEELNLI